MAEMKSKPELTPPGLDVALLEDRDETAVDAAPTPRILLLIDNRGNREQVAKRLQRHSEILIPPGGSLPEERFDLAIADGRGISRWHNELKLARQNEMPVFLPVMLILTRGELRLHTKKYIDIVDDFIITPSEPVEFFQRTAMLLRARRLAVQQRENLAYTISHDVTTGLPTREVFLKFLEVAIQKTNPATEKLYVVAGHIPTGQFTQSLGHGAAEEIIGTIVSDFQQNLDGGYLISRFNTDQGATLLPTGSSLEDAILFSQRLIQVIQEPRLIRGERVRPSAYVRVINYPDDAEDAATLLEAAMRPMSETQKSGVAYFYSPAAQEHALQFMRIEADLHKALEQHELELWFQPKFRLNDLALVGAEALIRWRKGSGELVSPGEFIPVAEQVGLIHRIDTWVIETAIAAMSRWQQSGLEWSEFSVAVNITPSDLTSEGFVPWLTQLLGKYELPPSAFEVEMTETMLMDIDQQVLGNLLALREHGIRVSIDDFGTGYSSLSYLQQLPADTLKIDKSFIDDIPDKKSGQLIVNAVVALGVEFGMELVAEGIENREQLHYLRARNVQTGQGFLISRPLPEQEFIDVMKNGLSIASGL